MSEFENIMRCERASTGNYGYDDYEDEEEVSADDGDLMDTEYESYRDMCLEARYAE